MKKKNWWCWYEVGWREVSQGRDNSWRVLWKHTSPWMDCWNDYYYYSIGKGHSSGKKFMVVSLEVIYSPYLHSFCQKIIGMLRQIKKHIHMPTLSAQVGNYCFDKIRMFTFPCACKWRRKRKVKKKDRKRRWWDLQQCLTVRNFLVYLNCNLFQSLSDPESCMCVCVWERVLSVYMPIHTCVSLCVSTCACTLLVFVWEVSEQSWIRPAVYSVRYKARRCLQQHIYPTPQLANIGSPHLPDCSYS